jgi:hypothetical protein
LIAGAGVLVGCVDGRFLGAFPCRFSQLDG